MYARIPQPIGCCHPTECSTSSSASVATGYEVVNVDTVADMAATYPYTALRQFNVSGNVTAGDGGGGIWNYLPSSAATADGYYVLTPPGGVGRYTKIV